jgi:hypothetical protein
VDEGVPIYFTLTQHPSKQSKCLEEDTQPLSRDRSSAHTLKYFMMILQISSANFFDSAANIP